MPVDWAHSLRGSRQIGRVGRCRPEFLPGSTTSDLPGRAFLDWYNHAHRHSGIRLLTPAVVHHGAAQLDACGATMLHAAYADTLNGSSCNHRVTGGADCRISKQLETKELAP